MSSSKRNLRLIEYALAGLALAGMFIFIQLSMSVELFDSDIWLHLKTGAQIIQNHAVPQTDFYSALAYAKPWIDHSPLTQVIFFWAFSSGGPDRLISLGSSIMLLAFLILFFCLYNKKSNLSLSIIILTLTIFASGIRFNIRPENFSVLFFCAYLFILTRNKNNKLIFILPLIQLVWVNCHGFFMLGLLLIALFAITLGLKLYKKLPGEWADPHITPVAQDKNSYRNLVIVFLLSALACLINPRGITGALYPLKIISDLMVSPSPISNYVSELLPPWKLNLNLTFAYYLLIAISFVSFLLNFRRINLAYLLAWLALLGMSFSLNRNIIFFNCVACLVSVDNFSRIDYPRLIGKVFADDFIFLLKYISLSTIILCFVICNLRLLTGRYYRLEEYREKSVLLGMSNIYPSQAADFILKHKLPDNLFNTFNHGAYLIYRLFPQNHVFIDGRTELYSKKHCEDYFRILYTDPLTIGGLLKKYRINTLLLSGDFYDLEELTAYLYPNPEWALVYLNTDGLIFVRKEQNPGLAEQLQLDLNRQAIKKPDFQRIGLRTVEPGAYLKLAQIFFALGADQKAEAQAQAALSVLPSAAEAYCLLSNIYLRRNNPQEAYLYLRLAASYAPNSPPTLLALGNYYLHIRDAQNAEKIYLKIVALYPRYAQGHYLLGTFYENTGNLKSALGHLRQAVKLAPYSTKYLNSFKKAAAKTKNT